jgi:integrase
MPRLANRLTALKVERLKTPGLHHDGGGLYLRVLPSGSKGWVLRFMLDKRPRYMGLGPYPLIGLAEARQAALDARRQRYLGVDPIEARHAQRASQRPQSAKGVTFSECAIAYIEAHRAGWKHPRHIRQWSQSLADYVEPVLGGLPVAAIDTAAVMRVLTPIWTDKPETASRVRGRIESILDWATVRGFRTGENPARWKGHLDKLLPSKAKVKARGHYAAMPWRDVPVFMRRLRLEPGVAARALEFIVLTAVRLSDLVGSDREDRTPMLWSHVAGYLWTVPATKNGKEHRVPLSEAAMAVLADVQGLDPAVVFPGVTGNMLAHLMRRLNAKGTVHGMRSAFRDWAAEATSFPNHVVEMALAHTVGGVEGDYRRGDLLAKRRELMVAWAAFLAGE